MPVLDFDPDGDGKDQFEDESFRTKDDEPDPKPSGTFAHNPKELSATECNEWISFFIYLSRVVKGGGGAFPVRNETGGNILAGPITITSWDEAEECWLIAKADADSNFAHGFLLATLANNTNATAYLGGRITGILNTSSSAEGAAVYLSQTAGEFTLTAPSGAGVYRQKIGKVATVSATGDIQALIEIPALALTNLRDCFGTPDDGDTVTWVAAQSRFEYTANATTDEKFKTDAADPTASHADGKTDNATLEVDASAHKIRVKDGGITLAKMANLAQDTFIIRTTASTGVPETAACTAAGRAILDDANAGAQRTTLELGSANTPTFAGLTINGPINAATITVENNTAVAAAPNVLTAGESRKLFENTGATAENHHELPAAAAGLGPYWFYVKDDDGIQVNAVGDDTIRFAGDVSGAAGNISSATVGSCIGLVAISATEWVGIASVGTWAVSPP